MGDTNELPFSSFPRHLQSKILEKFIFIQATVFHECCNYSKQFFQSHKSLKYAFDHTITVTEEAFSVRNVEVSTTDLTQVLFKDCNFYFEVPFNDERCALLLSCTRDCEGLRFAEPEFLACSIELFSRFVKVTNLVVIDWDGELEYLSQFDTSKLKIFCSHFHRAPIVEILSFNAKELGMSTTNTPHEICEELKKRLERGQIPRNKRIGNSAFTKEDRCYNMKVIKVQPYNPENCG